MKPTTIDKTNQLKMIETVLAKKTLEAIIQEKKREALREKARDSLYHYVKYMFEVMEEEPMMDNRHIQEICEGLEAGFYGITKDIIICVPPRSLKSYICCKLFPTWAIGQNGRYTTMITGSSHNLVCGFSQQAREIYQHEEYKKIFPNAPAMKKDMNQKSHWLNQKNGGIYAVGVGGTVTGHGCDCLIMDDLLQGSDASSETMRQTAWEFATVFSANRFDKTDEGLRVFIQQRLHEDDVVGRLLQKEKDTGKTIRTKFIYPAIVNGKSFFPGRYSLEYLEKQKAQMGSRFYAEFMQDPVDPECREFYESGYTYYDKLEDFINLPGEISFTIDLAFRKKSESDYTVILVCKRVYDKLYIIHYERGKYTTDQFIKKFFELFLKWNPLIVGIESIGAQDWIVQMVENVLKVNGKYRDNLIVKVAQSNGKGEKIRALLPFFNDKKIIRRKDMHELETEFATFPKGRHDDIIDALQMQYHIIKLSTPFNHNKGRARLRVIGHTEMGYPIYG